MTQLEQYEVWVQSEKERWELAAVFADLDVANAVAQSRPRRVRLVHSVYENGQRISEQVLAEIGATRAKA